MGSTTKSNKLKRKRGKKFLWRDPNGKEDSKTKTAENPFEEHSTSKRAKRDMERREALIQEYRSLGKNGQFVDNRIAEKSSKMSEEDKMKLRYLAEQREQAKSHLNTGQSRKRAKFNLDEDDSDENGDLFMGFTHKGKRLDIEDDFKEKIEESDDEIQDRGQLPSEYVDTMHFGGGELDPEVNQE